MSRILAVLIVVSLILIADVQSRTIRVAQGGSIQDSLNAAAAGDTVLVGPGIFYTTLTWPQIEGITLRSENGPETTTLFGADVSSVIRVIGTAHDTSSVIEGFTITRGQTSDGGGGIRIDSGAAPLIVNNVISNNAASGHGGGVLCRENSNPVIRANIIDGNQADSTGGGIAVTAGSSPKIRDNIITGNNSDENGGGVSYVEFAAGDLIGNRVSRNHSANGAGIYLTYLCAPTISGNVISGNATTSGSGGGIFATEFSGATISGNTIAHDTALTSGGGVALWNSSCPLAGNAIVENVCFQTGGGLDLFQSSPRVADNIIVRNATHFSGGGIFIRQSNPVVRNNIITGNSGSFGGGAYISDATPIIGDADSTQNDIYHNVSDDGANVKNFANIAATAGSRYNFWGRTHAYADDSLEIASTIVDLGQMTWWPISVTPQSVARAVKSPADTLYFSEGVIAFDAITFNASGDSTFTVTTSPDSDPGFSQSGRIPLQKWFDVSAGTGVADFSAHLTLFYTPEEVGASGDIKSELTLYVVKYDDPVWDSCSTVGRDTLANSVTCAASGSSRYIIVGTDQVPTDVDDLVDGSLPAGYSLSQNYPNPFNPATQFEYSVPTRSRVNIVIYNVLGQRVRLLLDEDRAPGTYKVVWDGKDGHGRPAASGIYLYRLVAGGFAETRKMVLVK